MSALTPCPLCGGPMSISFEACAFEAGTAGRMEPHWHAALKQRCDNCRYQERRRWKRGWPDGAPDQVRQVYGALAEMAEELTELTPPDIKRNKNL